MCISVSEKWLAYIFRDLGDGGGNIDSPFSHTSCHNASESLSQCYVDLSCTLARIVMKTTDSFDGTNEQWIVLTKEHRSSLWLCLDSVLALNGAPRPFHFWEET